MRILLAADVDLAKPGGLETHVLEVAGRLAARGHEVDVWARGLERAPGLDAARSSRASGRPRPVHALDSAGYDIVHRHTTLRPRGLDPGPRAVTTLHFCVAAKMDAYVRMGRLRTLARPGNWVARAEERRAAREPGALIAVSRRVLDEFARFHGIAAERATVIPNGASFEPPREGRAAWRARHGISEDTPVLLTIGRHDFVKGYDLLGRAWDAVRSRHPRALWVVVGGSAPERSERRLVTGSVPRDAVTEWIYAADLGALPSYYEGCSVALLEMLAGGLFTLAHDVGGAAEAIRSGLNGAIVARDPGAWTEALDRAIRHPEGRSVPGLDASYRWDAIVDSIELVYRSVRAEHP
jgi:glycosyltransferase involved in cell wall biosynthesis